jgi:hypothetical protein
MPHATKSRRSRRKEGPALPYTDRHGDEWEMGTDGIRTCWKTAAFTAESLDITTRRLQQLERIGMPSRGYRSTCRYPWPHAGIWWLAYQLRLARKERVAQLDIDDAMDEYAIQAAIDDAEIANRMRRDKEYRARMLAALAAD